MELSRKNSQGTNSLNGNNNINNNINNNNNNSVNDDKLSKIESLIKCAFESKNYVDSERSMGDQLLKSEIGIVPNDRIIYQTNEDCVKTSADMIGKYPKRLEPLVDADEPEEKKKNKQIYQTPDILLKNSTFEKHFDGLDDFRMEKPDILKNVFASDADEDSTDNGSDIAYEQLDDEALKIDEADKEEQKIDNHWSITPVDIVGNFKQEIEREFGLIVSGYRNSTADDDMMCAETIDGDDKDNGISVTVLGDNGSKEVCSFLEI